jgi:hypothetical protein
MDADLHWFADGQAALLARREPAAVNLIKTTGKP